MIVYKKISTAIMAAVLGIALVGGGTFAYFSDTATSASTFSSGTLELSANPSTIVELENLKPGDWTEKSFFLTNEGSLDIKKVLLHTDYTVTDQDGNPVSEELANQYAQALRVDFLKNTGDGDVFAYPIIVNSTSLFELKDLVLENAATEHELLSGNFMGLIDGIEAGNGENAEDSLYVKFRFKDSGESQNELQGLRLNLEWTFEAMQEDGEER
ncbi:cell division protein FtsN [Sediminibacillus dalangtanensis]|uniref:Cell division protein FtsN n=1 Tax=Sediminibacillus dalangtanensis TaxID=2729421 RepID=A0ABX7VXC1_9BACI|nr:cell division protein FtsN [Sediminibacillus dalangtanensis]